MAKIYGLFGAMSGKVSDVVMSVRNGQQIVRKYQPVVANPKTQNQFTTRARFKLLSQLSAVMAPVVAIPRTGGVSSRNWFTKINFPNTSFAENIAQITLTKVQLTKSVVGFSPISGSIAGTTLSIGLVAAVTQEELSRVVYSVFRKMEDGTLRFLKSSVVEQPGQGLDWATTISNVTPEIVVYAYGIRDNTESARLYFGNLTTLTGENIAKLIVSRTMTEQDITLTETQAVEISTANREIDNEETKVTKKK